MPELYDIFHAIYDDVAKQKQAIANQAAGKAYAAGDYQGAANQLALSGDVQGAQQFTANRQNEVLRNAHAQEYAAQAQERNLKAQQDFLSGVAPQLQSAYDKAEATTPGSGKTVLQTLYNGYVAPGLQSRGVSDQELQRYSQLAQDPATFFPTLGAIAKAKVQYHNVGDQLVATDETGKFLGVFDGKQWKTVRNGDGSEVLGSVGGSGTGIFGTPGGPTGRLEGGFGAGSAAAPSGFGGPPPSPPEPTAANTVGVASAPDRDALIRMVATEAGNQGPEGMAAVAHVALNRLNKGYGGASSISQVVNAPHQFEGMSRASQVSPADYQAAAQVVDGVLSGQVGDPTGGAVNFLNPQLQAQMGRQQPAWANGNGQRIGAHVFYGGNGSSGAPVQVAQNNAAPQAIAGFTPAYTTQPKPAAPGPVPFSADPARAKRFGIDEGVPGYFDSQGAPHVVKDASTADTGSDYTPQALDSMAQQFVASGGKDKPSLGFGKAGAAARALFYNRVAEIQQAQGVTGAGMVGRQASVRADTAALQQLTKTSDAINASEATASKAADFVLQGISGGGGTKYPLLNKAIIAGKRQTGDPAVDAYIARLGTFADEYAKVISGGTGSAAATDGVRKDAQRRISEAAAPDQLRAVIDSMKAEMQFRSGSLQDRIDQIHGRISGAPADGAPQKVRGWTNGLPDAQRNAAKQFYGMGNRNIGTRQNPYVPANQAQYNGIKGGSWFIDSDGQIVQKGGH